MRLGLICVPMHASSPGCATEYGHHRPLFKTVFKKCSKKSESFGFSFVSFKSCIELGNIANDPSFLFKG